MHECSQLLLLLLLLLFFSYVLQSTGEVRAAKRLTEILKDAELQRPALDRRHSLLQELLQQDYFLLLAAL
jgi:hypothetical protein